VAQGVAGSGVTGDGGSGVVGGVAELMQAAVESVDLGGGECLCGWWAVTGPSRVC
jgi:hypothetical protein